MEILHLIFTFFFLNLVFTIFAYILYLALTLDNNFLFLIVYKKQLRHFWRVLGGAVVFSFYIFFIRLNRVGISVNLKLLLTLLSKWVQDQSWIFLLVVLIILLEGCILGLLTMVWLRLYVKRCCLALYGYYYQRVFFRDNFCNRLRKITTNYSFYLTKRIKLFSQHDYAIPFAMYVWPYLFEVLSTKVFKYILPYTIIFDYITQNGVLTHVFLILPGCFVYYIVRGIIRLFPEFFLSREFKIVDAVYNSMEYTSKIYNGTATEAEIFFCIKEYEEIKKEFNKIY